MADFEFWQLDIYLGLQAKNYVCSIKRIGGFLGGEMGGGGGGAFFFLVAVSVWSAGSTKVSSMDSDLDLGGTGGGSKCPPFDTSAD